MVYFYAALAVSLLAVALITTSIHCAYLQRDGQVKIAAAESTCDQTICNSFQLIRLELGLGFGLVS